ncbi:hypothetical protein HN51_028276 [Arachis hypogaea]
MFFQIGSTNGGTPLDQFQKFYPHLLMKKNMRSLNVKIFLNLLIVMGFLVAIPIYKTRPS